MFCCDDAWLPNYPPALQLHDILSFPLCQLLVYTSPLATGPRDSFCLSDADGFSLWACIALQHSRWWVHGSDVLCTCLSFAEVRDYTNFFDTSVVCFKVMWHEKTHFRGLILRKKTIKLEVAATYINILSIKYWLFYKQISCLTILHRELM